MKGGVSQMARMRVGMKKMSTQMGNMIKNNAFAILLTSAILLGREIYKMITAQTALEAATDKINDKIAEETAELSILEEKIKDTNIGTKERNDLVDEMNTKYGDIIGNTLEYGASEEELLAAMDKVNDAFERRIKLEVLEEAYKESIAERIKLERELGITLEEAQKRYSDKTSAGFMKAYSVAIDKIITQEKELKNAFFDARNEQDKHNNSFDFFSKLAKNADVEVLTKSVTNNTKSVEENTNAYDDSIKIDKLKIKSIKEVTDIREKASEQVEDDMKVISEFEKKYMGIADAIKAQMKAGLDDPELTGLFGMTEEQHKDMLDSWNLVNDIFGDAADRRIEKIDEEIAKQDEKLNVAKSRLEEEKALEEEGLANDADLWREKVAQEKAAQEKLTKEREKAGKKRQLIAASEITMSYFAELASIAGYSAKNPLNVPTGGAAGATIFSIQGAIATARWLAGLAGVKAQKFQHGTEFVDGQGGIDNVPSMLTRGERVLTVGQNKELNGIPNDDIVDLARKGMVLNTIADGGNTDSILMSAMLSKMDITNEKLDDLKLLRKTEYVNKSGYRVIVNNKTGDRTRRA